MSPEKLAEDRLRELLSQDTSDAMSETLRLRALYPQAWGRVLIGKMDAVQWMRARCVTRRTA